MKNLLGRSNGTLEQNKCTNKNEGRAIFVDSVQKLTPILFKLLQKSGEENTYKSFHEANIALIQKPKMILV